MDHGIKTEVVLPRKVITEPIYNIPTQALNPTSGSYQDIMPI